MVCPLQSSFAGVITSYALVFAEGTSWFARKANYFCLSKGELLLFVVFGNGLLTDCVFGNRLPTDSVLRNGSRLALVAEIVARSRSIVM